MANWTQAMIDLNGALEEALDNGVTREEVLQEVDNMYPVAIIKLIQKVVGAGRKRTNETRTTKQVV